MDYLFSVASKTLFKNKFSYFIKWLNAPVMNNVRYKLKFLLKKLIFNCFNSFVKKTHKTIAYVVNCLCTSFKSKLSIYMWGYFWALFFSICLFVYLYANMTLSLLLYLYGKC